MATKRIIIREEPFQPGQTVFRAYHPDGVPLYLGAADEWQLREDVMSFYPDAIILRDDSAFRGT